jgi:hypothetical protein
MSVLPMALLRLRAFGLLSALCALLAHCANANNEPTAEGFADGGSAGVSENATVGGGGGRAGQGSKAGAGGEMQQGGTGGATSTTCASTTTCTTARTIGAIRGDVEGDVLDERGVASTWLSLNVNELADGIHGNAQKLVVELYSPTGANYDLYVYVDTTGEAPSSSISCNALGGQSINPSTQADRVAVSWGESSFGTGNNADDSRIVGIEIRHVDGPCDPTAKWQLIVRGNTELAQRAEENEENTDVGEMGRKMRMMRKN